MCLIHITCARCPKPYYFATFPLMKPSALFMVVLSCSFLLLTCQETTNDTVKAAPPPTGLGGEQLARLHCAACHPFPDPSQLDKRSWVEGVLPVMGHRFGFYGPGGRPKLIEAGVAGRLVERANIYPTEPTLAREDWEKIVNFYRERAPDSLVAPFPELEPTDRFSTAPLPDRYAPPMGTLI